jgi:hypothetical protein
MAPSAVLTGSSLPRRVPGSPERRPQVHDTCNDHCRAKKHREVRLRPAPGTLEQVPTTLGEETQAADERGDAE